MKISNRIAMLKLTIVTILMGFVGVQQTQAQLTVTNNLDCWLIIGEKEGSNCQACNNTRGTWVPPVSLAPNNVAVFASVCPASTIEATSPSLPQGFQSWIGIKYDVSTSGPPTTGTPSFAPNPAYLPAPCHAAPPATCGNSAVQSSWQSTGANGSTTVVFFQ